MFLKKLVTFMPSASLDILIYPTMNTQTFAVMDISTYDEDFVITSPTIKIIPPGFNEVSVPFLPKTLNVFNSKTLGITPEEFSPSNLPDGIYKLIYSVYPEYEYSVEISYLRTDSFFETFDRAYLKLEFSQCDGQLKKQVKEELNSVFHMINAAIASASSCAYEESERIYFAALRRLRKISNSKCLCEGNTFS